MIEDINASACRTGKHRNDRREELSSAEPTKCSSDRIASGAKVSVLHACGHRVTADGARNELNNQVDESGRHFRDLLDAPLAMPPGDLAGRRARGRPTVLDGTTNVAMAETSSSLHVLSPLPHLTAAGGDNPGIGIREVLARAGGVARRFQASTSPGTIGKQQTALGDESHLIDRVMVNAC
jgi:hypothetical protein